MKVLLIFTSSDMYSYDLRLQKTISNDPALIDHTMEQYRSHWRGKPCARLYLTVLEVSPETPPTAVFEEDLKHPLKKKIIINEQAKAGVKKTTSASTSPSEWDMVFSSALGAVAS